MERNVTEPLPVPFHQGLHLADEILDQQVVSVGGGVLEIGDRIDPERAGDLPGAGGKFGDRLETFTREYVPVGWQQHNEDVIALGVDVLQILERLELRVALTEKDTVVVGKLKESAAAGQDAHDDQGREDCDVAQTDQETGISINHDFFVRAPGPSR